MNPLIPVLFHVKSSTSLDSLEDDMLCFYCAEVVLKVTHHPLVHPSVFQHSPTNALVQ